MSNLDSRPIEEFCVGQAPRAAVEILAPRDVPLGGPRAMAVRRTLPQRARSLIGAWCFADHFGPDDVSSSAGMQVPPHPHCGLQTVTWLFAGEVLHRDSLGSRLLVRPGQLNLMTAGQGISHSEESPVLHSPTLHGAQLWVALPADRAGGPPAFEHHENLPMAVVEGACVRVFLGSAVVAGRELTSPATTYSPLVGAQLDLSAGARLELPVNPDFEHGLLVDSGVAGLDGVRVEPGSLGYVAPGRDRAVIEAGAEPVRAVWLGGEPLGEDLVMWWNFVGRSHDEVAQARAAWSEQLVFTGSRGPNHGGTAWAAEARAGCFGQVDGYDGGPLPAPTLPDVRLKPRKRR